MTERDPEVLALALAAQVDPRTARRWLLGLPMRAAVSSAVARRASVEQRRARRVRVEERAAEEEEREP